ncbi:unnamed protein product [Closterium sp. NIES-53]
MASDYPSFVSALSFWRSSEKQAKSCLQRASSNSSTNLVLPPIGAATLLLDLPAVTSDATGVSGAEASHAEVSHAEASHESPVETSHSETFDAAKAFDAAASNAEPSDSEASEASVTRLSDAASHAAASSDPAAAEAKLTDPAAQDAEASNARLSGAAVSIVAASHAAASDPVVSPPTVLSSALCAKSVSAVVPSRIPKPSKGAAIRRRVDGTTLIPRPKCAAPHREVRGVEVEAAGKRPRRTSKAVPAAIPRRPWRP